MPQAMEIYFISWPTGNVNVDSFQEKLLSFFGASVLGTNVSRAYKLSALTFWPNWPLFKAELTWLCREGQGLAKESFFSFYPRQTVQVHRTVNLQLHLSRRCRKFDCNVSDLYVWCLWEGQEETSMFTKMSGGGLRCLLNDPNLSMLWVPLR